MYNVHSHDPDKLCQNFKDIQQFCTVNDNTHAYVHKTSYKIYLYC